MGFHPRQIDALELSNMRRTEKAAPKKMRPRLNLNNRVENRLPYAEVTAGSTR